MNKSAKSGSRILVVKLSSLGDLFHVLPAVRCLKTGLGASVDWVTQPEYRELVECFTDVDRVITFPRQNFPRNAKSFLRELRQSEYDYIIDFQGLLKSAMVGVCARGRRRIGPSYSREGARLFYTDVAGRKNKNRHAVEEALDVVRFMNLEMLEPVFPVAFPVANRDERHPRIGMVPCSRWATKNWPPKRFASLGRTLRDSANASLFLFGGPADMAVCRGIEQAIGAGVVNTCGGTLVEAGSLLQAMDLVITVDSGPMHMAVAAGVPVVAIFGATDPQRTGPYGNGHEVVTAADLECRPCRARTCAREDTACLEMISGAEIAARTVKMLKYGEKENTP